MSGEQTSGAGGGGTDGGNNYQQLVETVSSL